MHFFTGHNHEEFETSHNPGYRVFSLARQQQRVVHLASSYPGSQPSHYVEIPSSQENRQDDLYYYSYPRTSHNLVQQTNNGIGIYSLEGPASLENNGIENEYTVNENETEYMYVSNEYVNGYIGTPVENNSRVIKKEPQKRLKPMPLPRTKMSNSPT